MSDNWKELVADKRKRQQDSIPREWLIKSPPSDQLDVTSIAAECGLLTDLEYEITELQDVAALLKRLATGELSSVDVTKAYYKRAIIAHQLTNCLTEIFVERALARAAELDEHLKTTGSPVGPLHGLPISLKDQIRLKGIETTMGYVSWIGNYAEHDAVLVEILYEAGAVPFVRTNVPQTLMWPETFNNVFGRTINPYNRSLTCGGSSGGEGALIALKGSPLGIGSDIGGSIRIPSAFNGLYGLRPSYGRVPYSGAANSLEGQDSIPSVFGPMTRSLSGIKAFMQAVIAGRPWSKDPLTIRKAWDNDAYQLSEHGHGKNLVFAILWDDGSVKPHPPILRGLEFAKKALLAAGHQVVDWKPYKHGEICANLGLIWSAGASEDYRTNVGQSGEPIIKSMNPNVLPDAPSFRPSNDGLSAYQLWQAQKDKTRLRKEYLDYWEASIHQTGTGRPIDAIISPVAAYAAPPHGMNKSAAYTMVWNALDYTALVIPLKMSVDPKTDVKILRDGFLGEDDRRNYELYDPQVYKNAPIALQVVGRTLEEEAVIGMSEVVDAAFKAHVGADAKL